MDQRLIGTAAPHVLSSENTNKIMRDVVIAMMPALIGAVYFFGLPALKLTLISVAAAVLTEFLIQKLSKKPVTISDLSAVVTGILLAYNIPSTAPWWLPIIGSVFAIGIAKQAFGGIGQNFINPALAGRAMLLASWPVLMTTWVSPGPDAVSTATPLAILKNPSAGELPSLMDAFLGNIGGCIGETSVILLLIGGIYLIIRKVISWKTPVAYILTVAILTFIFAGGWEPMLYHICSGGLILGAFFMATDYPSTPITGKGKIIFGIGAGILTTVIRLKGGYPEGVSYSILLMNLAAPLIEKFTQPKVFGGVK
ncbi:MAG: RnfABCDGE type electron transport complex subunit D [Andreesenia angusta]|nr:RnfABCDGE type electron transport complex subunit D [Andreesenia angusta]